MWHVRFVVVVEILVCCFARHSGGRDISQSTYHLCSCSLQIQDSFETLVSALLPLSIDIVPLSLLAQWLSNPQRQLSVRL